MKLLIVHNFYTHLTGEDLIVEEAVRILKNSKKIEVAEYYKYSKDFQKLSWVKKILTLLKTNMPFYIPKEFKETLDREKPDLIQIHNLTPLINIWILRELKIRKLPILYYINNYRLFCPRGTCFLKDRPCTSCADKSLIFCIINNCLGNFSYSLLYTYRVFLERLSSRHIDLFISNTNFTKGFYKRYLPKINITILKGYVDIPEEFNDMDGEKKDFVIFASRLVKEKGLSIILDSAVLLKDTRFKICGEGPEVRLYEDMVRRKGLKNIEFLGLVERKKILKLIKEARVLILPSLWYEVYNRLIIEAMSLGTPVIASKIGANAEIIQHNKTGFLFDPEDITSLVELIKRLWEDEGLRKKVSSEAYREVNSWNNPERYTKDLLETYNNLLYKTDV
jgi:glycosyltransferase involved in cell wall biosynthesis